MRKITDQRALTRRGRVWYVDFWETNPDGPRRHVVRSTACTDLDDAVRWRNQFLARREQRGASAPLATVPTFAEMAKRVVSEDLGHLALKTRTDRSRELGPTGPIVPKLGGYALDEITAGTLREWWVSEIEHKGLTTKSGRNYLDSIAHVYSFANEIGVKVASPVSEFRSTYLRRKAKTQRGRAEAVKGCHVRPIERPADIAALLAAAAEESLPVLVALLLGLDLGARKGEVFAVRWNDVRMGEDESDLTRSVRIDESASGGGPIGLTKSGRSRDVAMSRRLRAALLALYEQRTRQRDGSSRVSSATRT